MQMDLQKHIDQVISGLSDPDASVRKAAALNTGLYDDKDVLDAQERYFEKHRFGLTLSFIGDGIAALKTKSDRLDDAEYAIKAVDALRPNT
jgi:HEAT repeat protein